MIDLRSDTVTKPSQAMRYAIANAEVGDDVMGEDPTVIELERLAAEMLGFEDALLVTSGTQGNLLSLLSHLHRGESFIAGRTSHILEWEAGGSAILGGLYPQSVEVENDGTLDLKKVEKLLKPEDHHFAPIKLITLENTYWGKPLPLSYLEEFSAFAKKHKLKTHLDGARLFNAAVALDVDVKEITQYFDSVTFCLSKGLGAPIGSIIVSNKKLIKTARHLRKMLGSGMRQAGILAAAGLYALKHNLPRLHEDHKKAQSLANGLLNIDELKDKIECYTNMVFVNIGYQGLNELPAHLRKNGILTFEEERMRLVLHLDISNEEVDTIISAFKSFF